MVAAAQPPILSPLTSSPNTSSLYYPSLPSTAHHRHNPHMNNESIATPVNVGGNSFGRQGLQANVTNTYDSSSYNNNNNMFQNFEYNKEEDNELEGGMSEHMKKKNNANSHGAAAAALSISAALGSSTSTTPTKAQLQRVARKQEEDEDGGGGWRRRVSASTGARAITARNTALAAIAR